ncbi:MAG TPA: amidohydrolase family protein [Acidimicrobiales bacterium]|jgi:predicted TIM-barrel fold metal-dependent hydrolase|nr:amidohydrolase family protein [Acidimicrobiales bacterium]
MQLEDLLLVSVDDHVVEPPDLFAGHLPDRWRDVAPRMVTREDGTDVWQYDGKEIVNIGLNAVAGRPPEEYGMEPTSLHEMRPGCYDIHERVRDMDANGVLGSMCFPSFPNLCGQLFARSGDKDAALAIVKGYNDWHVDEWCGTYPGRFIPLMIPPLWDPVEMAAEVHRMAAKGCHAVTFSENPERLKMPSMHAEHWDPFWQACSDEGTIVCLHIGSSSSLVVTARDAPIDVLITLQPVNIVQCAADLMWSPVLRKFPDLRISLSEGGIGWIPYLLERLDWIYTRHHAWTGQDFGGRLPSEVFRERIVTCFIDDPVGLVVRDRVGIDRICWEADYPHSDSTWPTSPEYLMKSLEQVPGGVPDGDVDAITHQNAMRHFRFDPFAVHRREDCTVGALRARAAASGVDTSPLSVENRRVQPKDTTSAYLLRPH